MAVLSGFPQNVTYQSVTVAQGGGSENLLINPRGKINQANESAGVLAAGQYFCDGWKAGAAGAEVYVDSDGFRLVSGSIIQLVPNNLESGRSIRGNMDVLMGSPVISINGGSDNESSDSAEYIRFEISGNNSKFNRVILAESIATPVYQQSSSELEPCLKFLKILELPHFDAFVANKYECVAFGKMFKTPAAYSERAEFYVNATVHTVSSTCLVVRSLTESPAWADRFILDARL